MNVCTSRSHQMATVCREVLQGLNYLHQKDVVHRDIKSDNILLTMKGAVKITGHVFVRFSFEIFTYFNFGNMRHPVHCANFQFIPSPDFGFAANVAGNRMRKTFAGTPYWMAPEIINKNTYSTKVSLFQASSKSHFCQLIAA